MVTREFQLECISLARKQFVESIQLSDKLMETWMYPLNLPEELKKKKNICSIRYLEKLLHFLFNFCHFNLSNRINYASRQTFLIQINILRSRVI